MVHALRNINISFNILYYQVGKNVFPYMTVHDIRLCNTQIFSMVYIVSFVPGHTGRNACMLFLHHYP